MKRCFMACVLMLTALLLAASCAETVDYVDPVAYVDPMIATCSSLDTDLFEEGFTEPHANARCIPGACTPYGMVNLCPVTVWEGNVSPGYNVHDSTMIGFPFMRFSGSGWSAEFGNLLTMPTVGPLQTCYGSYDGSFPGYRQQYDKATETARVGYYSARLAESNILTECTATHHCGILRFTFPEAEVARIQSDLAFRITGSSAWQDVEFIDDNTFRGHMKYTPRDGGWGDGMANIWYDLYFYATLSKPANEKGFWSAAVPEDMVRTDKVVNSHEYLQLLADAKVVRTGNTNSGTCTGVFVEFPTTEGEQVEMRVGFSFVDAEGAKRNYDAEMTGKSFEQVSEEAEDIWRKELSRIKISGGTEAQKKIFYTALYHVMVDPRDMTDVDGRFFGADLKTYQTSEYKRRTIFSGWDVFRSQFPLQTIINPELVNDQIRSQMAMAEESGKEFYERWEMMNSYTGCMLGNPMASVLLDAYRKGIRNYDIDKAFRYMVNSSEKSRVQYSTYDSMDAIFVSHTLEHAYFDWCISQMASDLGRKDETELFAAKSQAWKDIMHPKYRWPYPKNEKGEWRELPEKGLATMFFGGCECNPIQQGWFVPHDMDTFVEMQGGRDTVLTRLNTFFDRTPFGQLGWNDCYIHTNEPVHWVPFLYNKLGEPWKTQKVCRTILNTCYFDDHEGLVGNDDCGQMSAWYVLVASGIHESCVGDGRVEILSPIFDQVEFMLDGKYHKGKSFTIKTHGASDENIYVQKAKLNGKELNQCWFDFSAISEGGVLELWMGPEPNNSWGI